MRHSEDRSRRSRGKFGAAVVAFGVSLLLARYLWGLAVPELFPGAVAQGLVAASLSWGTAAKVALAAAAVALAFGRRARTGRHAPTP